MITSTFSVRTSMVSAIATLGLAVLAAWAAPQEARAQLVPISDLSPYPDGGDPNDPAAVTQCNGGPQGGVVYRNSETEPYIAVNPTDPENMIAAWHQDRWSTGGGQGLGAAYSFDGGASWTQVNIPFTRCSGGAPRSAGDFERASDPWISFSPDGTAHYMALVFNDSISANGMAAASSSDGGVTWSEPVPITISPARDPVLASLFHDKNSFTADPVDSDLIYATWTLFRLGSTTLLFSRSTDGGQRWTHARPVNNFEMSPPPNLVTFRQGAQIVVLPDGTLVNAFFRFGVNQRTGQGFLDQAIFRSTDQGRHWELRDTRVAELFTAVAFDPELGVPVRDAGELPDIAVNRTTGDLYIAWQDTRFNSGLVGVVVARSTDGGDTWSAPVPVNRVAGVKAFLPSVSVNAEGTVGVLFYDFRNDVLGDPVLSTDIHLARFDPDLT
ncbi:MAG: glycoside hydrolase, partial [Rhodospirillales bacterium]|nr:glycoside hydrolase [Rhodospirillales bacterium]